MFLFLIHYYLYVNQAQLESQHLYTPVHSDSNPFTLHSNPKKATDTVHYDFKSHSVTQNKILHAIIQYIQ